MLILILTDLREIVWKADDDWRRLIYVAVQSESESILTLYRLNICAIEFKTPKFNNWCKKTEGRNTYVNNTVIGLILRKRGEW